MTESLEQRTNLTAEQQPVAWRWRAKGATLWVYDPTEEWRLANADKIEMQALYAAPPRPSQEPVAWEPVLLDKADGVRGHYSIGRYNPRGYWEFLNKGKWASAAEVIVIPDHRKTVVRTAEQESVAADGAAEQNKSPLRKYGEPIPGARVIPKYFSGSASRQEDANEEYLRSQAKAAPDATPETDAAMRADNPVRMWVTPDFARTLERQRNALQAQSDAQLRELTAIDDALGTNEGHSSVDHILALQAKLRKYRSALEEFAPDVLDAIDGNAKLVDEYTSVCVHSDRQGKQILELQSKLAQAEQDGKRYQWLRDGNHDLEGICAGMQLSGSNLDSAIDAALNAKPGEER